jgi:putative membrane protein
MRWLLLWVINALALVAIPYVVPSVSVSGVGTALVAAAILALVNTLLRPILILLTLPITILTLGLFTLVINALLFWLVSSFVSGFVVAGFGSAFIGALAYSIISTLLAWLLLPRRVEVRRDV